MNISVLKNSQTVRSAPGSSVSRSVVRWEEMSNENLKFALDLLSLHQSPDVYDVLFEIQQRAARGEWLDLDKPPPPLNNLPQWLKRWPFRLLWKQRD